jgi:hypothetical protein
MPSEAIKEDLGKQSHHCRVIERHEGRRTRKGKNSLG